MSVGQDMADLSVRNELGEELPIHSNMEDFCIECGVSITKENDSGWERFRPDGTTTQKICLACQSNEVYPQAKSKPTPDCSKCKWARISGCLSRFPNCDFEPMEG